MSRRLTIGSFLLLLLGSQIGLAQNATIPNNAPNNGIPGAGNLSNQDIANMAAMTRAMAGMHHHRGGVTGPAQAGAMQQMQAQQMMLRQQYAAAQLAAAKRAEKKEKVRESAERMRDKKEQAKKRVASKEDKEDTKDE